jgi:hypothetical protein
MGSTPYFLAINGVFFTSGNLKNIAVGVHPAAGGAIMVYFFN